MKIGKMLKNFWDICPSYLRWIVGTLGVLTINALAMPFGNYFLFPVLSKISSFFVNIMICLYKGMESIIYGDIAQCDTYLNTIEIKCFLYSLFLGFLIASCIINLFIPKFFERVHKKSCNNQEINKNEDEDNWKSLFKRESVIIVFVILVIAAFFTMSMLESIFVAQKRHDFYYKLSVCEPYMEYQEVLLIKSKFLRIKSRLEYNDIILKLDNILEKENITISPKKM